MEATVIICKILEVADKWDISGCIKQINISDTQIYEKLVSSLMCNTKLGLTCQAAFLVTQTFASYLQSKLGMQPSAKIYSPVKILLLLLLYKAEKC